MGMSLFGKLKKQDFVTDQANFSNFLIAVLTLFRITTGESWNGLMHDCMIQPPECTAGEDCGMPYVAVLYFVSYVVLSAFLMLNLFVAVVLKNFEAEEARSGGSGQTSWGRSPIWLRDIERYSEMWSKRFPNQMFIDLDDLLIWGVNLQFAMPEMIDKSKGGEHQEVMRHFPFKITRKEMKALDIPLWGTKIHYLSILQRISLKKFWLGYSTVHAERVEECLELGIEPPPPLEGEEDLFKGIDANNQLLQCINAEVQHIYPGLAKLGEFTYFSNQYYAAGTMKRYWELYKKRKGITFPKPKVEEDKKNDSKKEA